MATSSTIAFYGPTGTIDDTYFLCVIHKLVAVRVVIGTTPLPLLAKELFHCILAQVVTQKIFNTWYFKDVLKYLYKR